MTGTQAHGAGQPQEAGVFGFVCLVVVTEQKTADDLQQQAEDLFRQGGGGQPDSFLSPSALHQVKDHRTSFEVGNASGVIEDGDLAA